MYEVEIESILFLFGPVLVVCRMLKINLFVDYLILNVNGKNIRLHVIDLSVHVGAKLKRSSY